MKHYHAIWISDVHLGTKHSSVDSLLEFLKDVHADHIYLVGDIVDGWELKRSWFWTPDHNVLVQKLLRKHRKNCQITYIIGNHDEFLDRFIGIDFGGIHLTREAMHQSIRGPRYLVVHGHQFDGLVACNRFLERLGSAVYQWILDLNVHFNRVRRRFGFGYWSMAGYLKSKCKSAVQYISDFEESMVAMAKDREVDGIICGHIHRPEIRRLENLDYYNCGDWVENCTALVEDLDGRFELVHFHEDSFQHSGRGARAYHPSDRLEGNPA